MTTLADLIAEVAAEHVGIADFDGRLYCSACATPSPCPPARLAAAFSVENVAAGLLLSKPRFYQRHMATPAMSHNEARRQVDITEAETLIDAAALLAAITVPA